MAVNPIPIIRGVQGVLAIIILGLVAYVVSEERKGLRGSSDEPNFMIWNCIWTFLALLYLGLAPTYLPNLHHKYAVLAVESLSVIFWFAGFIALAVFISPCGSSGDPICGSLKAASAFGAFEWLAWCASLALVIRALLNYRKSQADTGIPGGNEGPIAGNSYQMNAEGVPQYQQPKYEGLPASQPINVVEANPQQQPHYQPAQYTQHEQPLEMPAPAAYGAHK